MTEKILTAKSAKNSARLFHLVNIVVLVIPVLIPIWFGASIFIYAMNRHNPNPRVGYFTQWGAYLFYGVIGVIIPVATFFPPGITNYLILWAILATIVIPASIYFLIQVGREQWQDTVYS